MSDPEAATEVGTPTVADKEEDVDDEPAVEASVVGEEEEDEEKRPLDDTASAADDLTEPPEEDLTEHPEEDDEDELLSIKSHTSEDGKHKEEDVPTKEKPSSKSPHNNSSKKRSASVPGLSIPFRTVKKAMKLDPAIPIVQNEAAVATTFCVELFLKNLAKESYQNAKNRGRNTVRYEDVAEARTSDAALAFLETLLP